MMHMRLIAMLLAAAATVAAAAQAEALSDWVESNLVVALQERGIAYAEQRANFEGAILEARAHRVSDLEPCLLEFLSDSINTVAAYVEAEQPEEQLRKMLHSSVLHALHSPVYEASEPEEIVRQIGIIAEAVVQNLRSHLPDFVDEAAADVLQSKFEMSMRRFMSSCTFHGYKAPLDKAALDEVLAAVRGMTHHESEFSYFDDVRRWSRGELTEIEQRSIDRWEREFIESGIIGAEREARLAEVMDRLGRPTPERIAYELDRIGIWIIGFNVTSYWASFVDARYPELDTQANREALHQIMVQAGIVDGIDR